MRKQFKERASSLDKKRVAEMDWKTGAASAWSGLKKKTKDAYAHSPALGTFGKPQGHEEEYHSADEGPKSPKKEAEGVPDYKKQIRNLTEERDILIAFKETQTASFRAQVDDLIKEKEAIQAERDRLQRELESSKGSHTQSQSDRSASPNLLGDFSDSSTPTHTNTVVPSSGNLFDGLDDFSSNFNSSSSTTAPSTNSFNLLDSFGSPPSSQVPLPVSGQKDAEYETQIQRLNEEKIEIERRANELFSRVRELTEQNENLEKTLNDRNAANQLSLSMEDTYATSERENQRLKSQIEEHESTQRQLREKIGNLRAENESLLVQNNALNSQLNNEREKERELEIAKENNAAVAGQFQEQIKALNVEVERLERELHAERERYQNVIRTPPASPSRPMEKDEKDKERISQLEMEASEQRNKIEDLVFELDAEQKKCQGQQRKLEFAEKEIDRLQRSNVEILSSKPEEKITPAAIASTTSHNSLGDLSITNGISLTSTAPLPKGARDLEDERLQELEFHVKQMKQDKENTEKKHVNDMNHLKKRYTKLLNRKEKIKGELLATQKGLRQKVRDLESGVKDTGNFATPAAPASAPASNDFGFDDDFSSGFQSASSTSSSAFDDERIQLEEQIDFLEKKNSSLTKELTTLKAEMNASNQKLGQWDAVVTAAKNLSQQNIQLTQQYNQLKEQHEVTSTRKEELEGRASQLEFDLYDLRAELEKKEEELKSVGTRGVESVQSAPVSDGEKEQLKQEVEQSKEQKEQLKQEVEQLKKEVQEKEGQMQKLRDELKSRVESLEEQKKEREGEIESFREREAKLSAELSQIIESQKRTADLQSQQDVATHNIETSLEQAKREYDRLSSEHQKLQGESDQLREKLQQLESDYNGEKEKAESFNERVVQLEGSLRDASATGKRQIEEREEKVAQLEERVAELESQIADSQTSHVTEHRQLEEENTKLRQNVESLTSQLKDANANAQAAAQERDETARQLTQLQEELTTERTSYEAKSAESSGISEQLQREMTQLREQLRRNEEEISRTTSQLSTTQEQLKANEEQLKRTREAQTKAEEIIQTTQGRLAEAAHEHSQLEVFKNEKLQLERDIEVERQRAKRAESEAARLQEQMNSQSASEAAVEQKLSNLDATIQLQEKLITTAQTEKLTLQHQLESTEKSEAQLRSDLKTLRDRFDDIQRDITLQKENLIYKEEEKPKQELSYIKNVVLKYLTANPIEHEKLLPIMGSILQFTNDEFKNVQEKQIPKKRGLTGFWG
ncbi:myosin II heavy chain [Planoprotostelium fungivorum]|uniref:Myosin II heavy chain n=1 Tax=Planoprotostelium fungivorum TaxID=1890364 RepID=A0A2P6NNG1_9EUKA|nr:myosin II heavy chain [Planoprotostelium fungivorum]